MSAVNDRIEVFDEIEDISQMNHFSQTTLDLLKERSGIHFLITGHRGGTGTRGGLFNHMKRLEQQRRIARIIAETNRLRSNSSLSCGKTTTS